MRPRYFLSPSILTRSLYPGASTGVLHNSERSRLCSRKKSIRSISSPGSSVVVFLCAAATHRDRDVRSPPRQSSLPPYGSFRDGQGPCVPARIGRKDNNEGHSKMSQFDNGAGKDSTDPQSSPLPCDIPTCRSCISPRTCAPAIDGGHVRGTPKEVLISSATTDGNPCDASGGRCPA